MSTAPRETADLLAADHALDFENWLLRRLFVPRLFDDPPCLTAEYRRERVRGLLVTRGLEYAIAGRRPGGGAETWGELFERVYGEPLISPKPRRPKSVPKSRRVATT